MADWPEIIGSKKQERKKGGKKKCNVGEEVLFVFNRKGGTALRPRATAIVGICHRPSGRTPRLLKGCDLCLKWNTHAHTHTHAVLQLSRATTLGTPIPALTQTMFALTIWS